MQMLETFNAMFITDPLGSHSINNNENRRKTTKGNFLDVVYNETNNGSRATCTASEGLGSLATGKELESVEPIEIEGFHSTFYHVKFADGRDLILDAAPSQLPPPLKLENTAGTNLTYTQDTLIELSLLAQKFWASRIREMVNSTECMGTQSDGLPSYHSSTTPTPSTSQFDDDAGSENTREFPIYDGIGPRCTLNSKDSLQTYDNC